MSTTHRATAADGAAPDEKLFSYGTLQTEAVQLATFGRRLEGTRDSLPGFRIRQLEIRDAAVIAASGQTHHPMLVRTSDMSEAVEGTVFKITAAELAQADAYEVADYQRDRVTLASREVAWVYLDAGRSRPAA